MGLLNPLQADERSVWQFLGGRNGDLST
jgi:hypothetical protein